MFRRSLIAVGAAAAIMGALAMTASAAKPERETVNLDCGADGVMTASVVPGDGQWTPAKLLNGGGTIIPVAFTDQHATFTDNDGNTFNEDAPDVFKNAPPNKDLMTCSFTLDFEEEGGSGTFSGVVTAWIAGHHSS
jgi:hypothetical protein